MLRAPCRPAYGLGRPRRSLDHILCTTGATARIEGHQERQRRQGLLRDGPDVPQCEYNDWYLDMMKKKVDPKKPEGMLQATRMCIYNCERNKRGLPCVLKKADDGTLVATCGIVHTQCGDERAEKRFFQEDPEKSLAGVRAEEDVHEQSKELVRPITGAEIGRPDLDGLVCKDAADDDDEANWDPLRKANMRLNQCTVWFNCFQDKRPGAFYLTTDEILTARRALRAVCICWAQLGGDVHVAHSASPVFWAIGLALDMVSRRVDGYTVPTPDLQGVVSPEGLHAYLEPRKVRSRGRGRGRGRGRSPSPNPTPNPEGRGVLDRRVRPEQDQGLGQGSARRPARDREPQAALRALRPARRHRGSPG